MITFDLPSSSSSSSAYSTRSIAPSLKEIKRHSHADSPYGHDLSTPSPLRLDETVWKSRRPLGVRFTLPSVKTKKRSGLVLVPTSAFKSWWDFSVVLLVIYSAFTIPISLCFDIKLSAGFDIFVDVVFYLDVIFYFFTTYTETGVTIYSHRQIAQRYLNGWFVVDLIACIPWELFAPLATGDAGQHVLEGCRALRLLRLNRLFQFLQTHQMISHAMRMLRMSFFFFLFAHWIACLWFALGSWNYRKSDGLEGWLSGLTPPLDPDKTPRGDLYITALYWVFTTWITIGYGDIHPRTDLEKCFAMSTMVVGAIIYATIFGTISVLLQSLGRLDNIFKEKMENISFYMHDLSLPPSIQTRVRNYYTFLWARHKSFSASNQLEDLPPSLANQIAQ